MKALLEKLKSLDKRLLIVAGVAIVLIIAIIVAICIVVGNIDDKAKDDNKTDDTTIVQDDTTKEDTTAEDTTEADTTEADTTEAETTEAETTEAETTAPDTTAPVVNQNPVTTPVTDAPVTNPSGEEILGQGSKDNPYLEIPTVGTNSMSVTTVAVPAGKSLFYSIQRIGGMYVTINSPAAYVVCNGVRYNAQNGVVAFVAPAALASDFITLEIGNTGGAAASFTLVFTNLTGTQSNPLLLTSMGAPVALTLPAGDDDGYFYKYYAEKAGTIRFYVTQKNADYIMMITNNRNSAQRTSEADLAEDANGAYIEMQVNAGDELIINVGAKPDRRNNRPALNMTWVGKFI